METHFGLLATQGDADLRSEMKHRVYASHCFDYVGCVQDGSTYEPQRRTGLKVGAKSCAQIVEDSHFPTLLNQLVSQVRANETGATRYERTAEIGHGKRLPAKNERFDEGDERILITSRIEPA